MDIIASVPLRRAEGDWSAVQTTISTTHRIRDYAGLRAVQPMPTVMLLKTAMAGYAKRRVII